MKNTSFELHNFHIRWFEDGTLNVAANCIDRHLQTRAQSDRDHLGGRRSEANRAHITYAELHREVCRFANVLKANGVKKGDRVTIYLPMIPEAAYAMLACARIGAVHSVVFAGFSPDSLAGRILDCNSDIVITADEGLRGGKTFRSKRNTDVALTQCSGREARHRGSGAPAATDPMHHGRDVWYHDEVDKVSDRLPARGNGRGRSALHSLYFGFDRQAERRAAHQRRLSLLRRLTHKYVFDYHDGDIYWCTADVGWVTGHSYIVYGPLANGATTLMFEGVPNYPPRRASGR